MPDHVMLDDVNEIEKEAHSGNAELRSGYQYLLFQ